MKATSTPPKTKSLATLPCIAFLIALSLTLLHAEPPAVSPQTLADLPPIETAVLGAGCFWCTEAIYKQQPGVLSVTAGYAGDTTPNPTYEQVSSGRTKYVEVVKIEFNPIKTNFQKLLDIFWRIHDPTNPHGVWPDFGPQYRSIIFYTNDQQRKIAEQSKDAKEDLLHKAIVTEIKKLDHFYLAEDYHQDYVRNHPNNPYVRNIAIPKLKKLGLEPPN